MTRIEQLVRKFFLEYTFENQSILELYRTFKETTGEKISFDVFRDAYFLVGDCFTSSDPKDDGGYYRKENISSEEEIDVFFLTSAYYYFSKLFTTQLHEELLAVFANKMPSCVYSDLSLESISDAYLNNKDYTIYRFGIDDEGNYTNKTIEYSITAEELKKQVNEAIKEIESVGKIPIWP